VKSRGVPPDRAVEHLCTKVPELIPEKAGYAMRWSDVILTDLSA